MTRDKSGGGRGSGNRRNPRANRGGTPTNRGRDTTPGDRAGGGDTSRASAAGGRGAAGTGAQGSTGGRDQAGGAGGRRAAGARDGGPATPLATVFDGTLPPGRYRLPALIGVRALREEATAASWASAVADGAQMTDKTTLLDEFARALAFPDWFGNNWDALLDCLADLSWLDTGTDGEEPAGIVLLWQRVAATTPADPDVYTKACQIVDSAIERRVEAGLPPLYVLYPAPADAPTKVDRTTGWTLTQAN